MKRVIIVLSLFFAGTFVFQAQAECDTVKWKTLKSYYCMNNSGGSGFDIVDDLNGAILNIDTFPFFYPGYVIKNISNDTFFANKNFTILTYLLVYSDTGLIAGTWPARYFPFDKDYFPNDTLRATFNIKMDLLNIVNQLAAAGYEFEQISYWQMISGVAHTAKDGYYSDSVYHAGADTATFHVIKSPVSILESTQTEISVFPNPAQSQFTVTNTENAALTLYNILGQKVKQVVGEGETTIISTEDLQQGIYILKIEKGDAVLTKKVQISE